MKYFICWSDGRFKGRASEAIDRNAAQAWVDFLNTKYPNIRHWLEPEEQRA